MSDEKARHPDPGTVRELLNEKGTAARYPDHGAGGFYKLFKDSEAALAALRSRVEELEAEAYRYDVHRAAAVSQMKKAEARAERAAADNERLRAALREVHPPGKGSHGNAIDDGIFERCEACRALATTEEEVKRP